MGPKSGRESERERWGLVVAGAKKYLYQSQQWHEDCFKCSECSSSIGTNSFIPHDGQPVCVACYHDKYAIKCVKCNGVSGVVVVFHSSFLARSACLPKGLYVFYVEFEFAVGLSPSFLVSLSYLQWPVFEQLTGRVW